MSKNHCPDLISMAECEMSRKKRRRAACAACHLGSCWTCRAEAIWVDVEWGGVERLQNKEKPGVIWCGKLMSHLQLRLLDWQKEAPASEEPDRSQRGFVVSVTLIFSHPDTLLLLSLEPCVSPLLRRPPVFRLITVPLSPSVSTVTFPLLA